MESGSEGKASTLASGTLSVSSMLSMVPSAVATFLPASIAYWSATLMFTTPAPLPSGTLSALVTKT